MNVTARVIQQVMCEQNSRKEAMLEELELLELAGSASSDEEQVTRLALSVSNSSIYIYVIVSEVCPFHLNMLKFFTEQLVFIHHLGNA